MKNYGKISWTISIILFFCGAISFLPGNSCWAASLDLSAFKNISLTFSSDWQAIPVSSIFSTYPKVNSLNSTNNLGTPSLGFLAEDSSKTLFDVTHTTFNATLNLANGKTKTVPIHLWYPSINREIDMSGAPYPLVTFSHGASVGSPTNCQYITANLAKHGYIVVATTHENSVMYKGQKTSLGSLSIPLDIKAMIDVMLSLNNDPGSILYEAIDENAIGVSGHSMGGWAAEVVCGAAPNKMYADERVKAGLFIEPGNVYGPMAQNASQDMHAAGMWIFGTLDELVRPNSNNYPYDDAPVPKYCMTISGLDHFKAAMGNNRTIEEYGVAFFDKYLKGDTSQNVVLQQRSANFADYVYDTSKDSVYFLNMQPGAGSWPDTGDVSIPDILDGGSIPVPGESTLPGNLTNSSGLGNLFNGSSNIGNLLESGSSGLLGNLTGNSGLSNLLGNKLGNLTSGSGLSNPLGSGNKLGNLTSGSRLSNLLGSGSGLSSLLRGFSGF
ncbi:MAG: hypothetical protein V1662_05425 [Candidatus Omnitrophota bacterium]